MGDILGDNKFNLNYRNFVILMFSLLLLMDISIIFNISIARELLGFILLTILPGILLLEILKLKLSNIEKIILAVGLSIAINLFLGLILNQLSLSAGYMHPLSTKILLICYNLLFLILVSIAYLRNKTKLINLKFKTDLDIYLIFPLIFPVLAVLGSFLMNNANINFLTMLLLILIPFYVIMITLNNSKMKENVYPLSLFLMGISLLLMWALRSDHIIFGADTDWEYYLYHMTLIKEYWMNFTNVTYDSCISITILPVIYLKFTGLNPEYLFRILYPLLFAISPLIVYSIAKKYLGNLYAFLSTFFFISFYQFFTTNNRVDIALIFFGLIVFTWINDNIKDYYKKIFIIIFIAACILSHYSTAFITMFILIFTFVIVYSIDFIKFLNLYIGEFGPMSYLEAIKSILNSKNRKKVKYIQINLKSRMITITLILLFVTLIFLWEGYVMQTPFDNLVYFITQGILQLKNLFLFESSNIVIRIASGQSSYLGIAGRIEFILSWFIIFSTFLGIIGSILLKTEKFNFLNLKSHFSNIDLEILILSFIGFMLLILSFIMPFISIGYNILRTYFQMLFFMDIFIIIGVFFIFDLLKRFKKFDDRKSFKNVKLIFILAIIIPYFFCTTGVMYQLFNVDRSISLNSHGKEYNDIFIHEEEIYGAKWLAVYKTSDRNIKTDYVGRLRVIIGGLIDPHPYSVDNNILGNSNFYIYLRYYNVVNKEIMVFYSESNITTVPLSNFTIEFNNKDKLYDNGGTNILY